MIDLNLRFWLIVFKSKIIKHLFHVVIPRRRLVQDDSNVDPVYIGQLPMIILYLLHLLLPYLLHKEISHCFILQTVANFFLFKLCASLQFFFLFDYVYFLLQLLKILHVWVLVDVKTLLNEKIEIICCVVVVQSV